MNIFHEKIHVICVLWETAVILKRLFKILMLSISEQYLLIGSIYLAHLWSNPQKISVEYPSQNTFIRGYKPQLTMPMTMSSFASPFTCVEI